MRCGCVSLVQLLFLLIMFFPRVVSFKLLPFLRPLAQTKLRYHIASCITTTPPTSENEATLHSLQVINIVGESEMEEFGASFASVLQPGKVVLLRGDSGAGKSTFCRALIRSLCEDPDLIVTSPTYLLDNTYEFWSAPDTASTVHHIDLYRLPNSCDLSFLSIPMIFDSSLCLIEWPERLGKFMPQEYTSIDFRINADESRCAEVRFVGKKYNDAYKYFSDFSI